MPTRSPRPIVAVIGQGGPIATPVEQAAAALGAGLMAKGYRLVTGGLDGVMAAVCHGARGCPHWEEGRIVGVLPGADRRAANPWVDIVIPTGLGMARNMVIATMADAVVVVAGGAGTLSEIAAAWQLGKPIIALQRTGGWAEELAGGAVDPRPRAAIMSATDPQAALQCLAEVLDR